MFTLPPDFWERENRKLLAILRPKLEGAALAGAQSAANKIGFNPTLASEQAAMWARTYTDELLQLLGTTSEKLVGDTLATWIETPGATMDDLVSALAPKLADNVARANTIAVTETTRAYAQGEKFTFVEAGFEYWTWKTNRDAIVQKCPICWPLHNKTVAIGEPFTIVRGLVITEPPGHPKCRCWTAPAKKP